MKWNVLKKILGDVDGVEGGERQRRVGELVVERHRGGNRWMMDVASRQASERGCKGFGQANRRCGGSNGSLYKLEELNLNTTYESLAHV